MISENKIMPQRRILFLEYGDFSEISAYIDAVQTLPAEAEKGVCGG